MKCYFLRHGLAADRDEWTGSDFDRPLTDRGRDKMAAEAERLADLGLDLDAIVTSPLVRAKQTAAIAAKALDMKDRLVEDERAGEAFDPSRLASILQSYSDAGAIMLVGHEPSFSQTIGHVTGGARIDLKKGGLACVEFPTASSLEGTLLWLIPPKVLAGLN